MQTIDAPMGSWFSAVAQAAIEKAKETDDGVSFAFNETRVVAYPSSTVDGLWQKFNEARQEEDQPPPPKKLVLLRIPPRDTPIYFVVAADIYRPDEPVDDGDEYFYNEHTCPTNWLRDVERVIAGDSADPHGFAEWVASIPAGDLLDEADSFGGLSKLDTLHWNFPGDGDGWQTREGSHARRVLALFGVENDAIILDGEVTSGSKNNAERARLLRALVAMGEEDGGYDVV